MRNCLSLSSVWKIMFSFDLSTINIFLIAAVAGLFILFITVLMKLNPSTETKEKAIETETRAKTQQLNHSRPVSWRNQIPAKIEAPRVTEKPPVAVSSTIEESSVPAKQEPPAPTRSQSMEFLKPEKAVAPAKTVSASSKKDCLHQFGYLRTLPKNAPIPDECFGCTKIVECLVKAKLHEG